MSDRDALLRAIIENPAEDTPRLVYADALWESGEEERAEFVRVQCELARGIPCEWQNDDWNNKKLDCKSWNERLTEGRVMTTCGSCRRAAELRRRERELLALDYSPILGGRSRQRNGVWERNPYGIIGAAGLEMNWCDIRRGFVEAVECDWQTWLAHEAKLYWRSGATDECKCGVNGCEGLRARPFVATAQPITDVRLTNWPIETRDVAVNASESSAFISDDEHRFDRLTCDECGIATGHSLTGLLSCSACHGQPLNSWSCERWPGLRFVMPEVTALSTAVWTEAHLDWAQTFGGR